MTETILNVKEMNLTPKTSIVLSLGDIERAGDLSRKQILVRPPSASKQSPLAFYATNIVGIPDLPQGTIGLSSFVMKRLGVVNGGKADVNIELRSPPDSYNLIKKRMQNQALNKAEIDAIIADVVNGRLSTLEKEAFVLSQYYQQYSMDEVEYLCRAIADTGETVDFNGVAADKHSLGGVPGNKVSLLLVPILAAAGLLIPKTSSRAITSASGTADTVEALGCRVAFKADEIIEITKTTGGLICWGGALNLAPADDILINDVEFPLGINPRSMMMASIMAKKKAFGIEMMVLDVPTGKGCKVGTVEEAQVLSRAFSELGRRLGIRVECGITFGNLPIGHTVGPALEAREALSALMNPKDASNSLVEKSTALSGILLEMVGKALRGQGQARAREILFSGQAYKKMQEIIEAQEGDPAIKPADISVGGYTFDYLASSGGWIVEIDNNAVTRIARAAGAPTDKGAGLEFLKKKEAVKAGETVFRIFANSEEKIREAQAIAAKTNPVTIEGMLLGRI